MHKPLLPLHFSAASTVDTKKLSERLRKTKTDIGDESIILTGFVDTGNKSLACTSKNALSL